MTTEQEQFWQSPFGDEYSDRNDMGVQELDRMYKERYSASRSDMNREFLSDLSIASILEVGSNIGNQLLFFKEVGYKNLTGLEINKRALRIARERLPEATFVEGSALSLPFPDNTFDLVFTSGVLIHISPADVKKAMSEIYRAAKRYIWGFEYFDTTYHDVEYRGNKERLWKGNFAELYLNTFPNLVLLKEKRYPYTEDQNLIDAMFLLEKLA